MLVVASVAVFTLVVVLRVLRVLSAMHLWFLVAASALRAEQESQRRIMFVAVAVLHLRQVQSSARDVEIDDKP
jgi:hypothetical protein